MRDRCRSDSQSLVSPRQRAGMRRGGLCFATTHPSDRTQSAAQHLLAIAASSNASLFFLQQAGPADIWHWTGRHRELNRFCPSAQLSGRSQLHESCILSQNLPKVIFFFFYFFICTFINTHNFHILVLFPNAHILFRKEINYFTVL